MKTLSIPATLVSMAFASTGCVLPNGGAAQSAGQVAADLGVCTAPAYPSQIHVKCTAKDPSDPLQSVEGTFDLSNPTQKITTTLGTERSVSGDVSGNVALGSLGAGSSTQTFAGSLKQANYTANGETLTLNLTDSQNNPLAIDIQLYYALPATVTWQGTQSQMTCTADSAFPTASATCSSNPPSKATVTCTNTGTTLAVDDVQTIEADIDVNYTTSDFSSQGPSLWGFNGHTLGSMTATQVNGQQIPYSIEGGSLSAALAADGITTFSWTGATSPNDNVVITDADASGASPTQVMLQGKSLSMSCNLHFN